MLPLLAHGPVAQLGERLHGMQEVVGSIPIGSTSKACGNLRLSCYLQVFRSAGFS